MRGANFVNCTCKDLGCGTPNENLMPDGLIQHYGESSDYFVMYHNAIIKVNPYFPVPSYQ